MEQLKAYLFLLEEEIKGIDLPQHPENLYQPLTYFFSLGGKRLRPVLTLLASELFDCPKEKAVYAALAVEYFHNFSLIHDDIMDEAPLRRKMQTVHQKWNQNIAILSGDVLLVKAYQELCKQENRHLPELMRVFNQTAVEVCEGQQLDMDFESRGEISVDEYIEMIRLKTSVLLGGALQMGAIIADAGDGDKTLIYDFGVNLGIAFQIQDDLLDLFANPEKFGKQVGGDIIANKKTLLTIKAKELAGQEEYEIFENKIGSLTDADKVETARHYFTQWGVKAEVLAIRDSYFTLAEKALNAVKIREENKRNLRYVIEFLKDREV